MPADSSEGGLWQRLHRSLASRRVEVHDRSMLPTLHPGDRLRVDRTAFRTRLPQPGEVVVVVDPEAPERWLVKRVGAVRPAGSHAAFLTLHADNPAVGRDSRTFGEVPLDRVIGRVYFRYAPTGRRGPL